MNHSIEKKIAFIGNMNNNFFSIVRYLRDAGYNAHLYLLPEYEQKHFYPETDSYNDDYKRYTHEITWHYFLNDLKNVKKKIQKYDFIAGCDRTPFLASKVNRNLDLFIPYGSDIYSVPFMHQKQKWLSPFFALDNITFNKIIPKLLWNIKPEFYKKYHRYVTSYHQYKGIKKSRHIMTYGGFESIINKKFNMKNKNIRVSLPMVYAPQYLSEGYKNYKEKSNFYFQFKKIREASDIVIFHHSRQVWKTLKNHFAYKGNNKLFKACALFIKKNPDIRTSIICFEYGPDVQESKSLISELGISENVIWMPQMTRKDIMTGISLADIGAVNFGNTWFSGGVLYEFLAQKIPVLQHYDPIKSSVEKTKLYPFVPANNENDIYNFLEEYKLNKEKYKKMGEEGFNWYQKNVVDEFLKVFANIIESN